MEISKRCIPLSTGLSEALQKKVEKKLGFIKYFFVPLSPSTHNECIFL